MAGPEVETGDDRSPLGVLSAGAKRVLRPAEVDYARAEEDTFVVLAVGEQWLSLTSAAREALGEGPAAPVAVPARATRFLQPDDIVHAEIAPTASGWEILHVVTVFPGGFR